MSKNFKSILFISVISFSSGAQTYYGSRYGYGLEKKPQSFQYVKPKVNNTVGAVNDSSLVQAVNQQRNVHYLEAANLQVVKLLPDDISGREHQKFMVRLSNGRTIQVVSNLDMCERIPVSVGDMISVGGEFIWTRQGGLVHWVHHDPKGNRQDGYVALKGKFYCR